MTTDKAQAIRLADMVLIGPYLIWLAWNPHKKGSLVLVTLGALTIVYNAWNWFRTFENTGDLL